MSQAGWDCGGNHMGRILLLGGYGVFGSRAAERLAGDPILDVIIAGRSEAAAAALVRRLERGGGARLSHARLDATRLTADDLRRLGVSIVINCAGPYQPGELAVARAAIAAGAHYIDLADNRAFVTGITALDADARRAGVLVVSGASSVPALAAAAIDAALPRFGALREVEVAISPGNSFDPGVATTASILAQVGAPHATLVEGARRQVHGWLPMRRHRFQGAAIGSRRLGHCDVPDLDLFPARYPQLRTQRFLAGLEVGLFHCGLWLLAWARRWGLIARPERLARPLLALKRWLRILGSDRGAMYATLRGTDPAGRALEVEWELVANEGHGPFIPATPAVLIARGLAAGTIATRGATAAVGLMSLAVFTAAVADLDIRQSVRETRPLYARVLGERFAQLPQRVRALHDLDGQRTWSGSAGVERGANPIAQVIGWIAGLPAAGPDQPLSVTFTPDGGAETWDRRFTGKRFLSRQHQDGADIIERVGPAALHLRPAADADGLTLSLAGMRVLGLPVPRLLLPIVATREWEEEGRYRFEVDCRIRGLGRLVRYSGWLEPR